MTAPIGRHNIGAGPILLSLFDQIAQRLIDQSLELPALALREVADAGQNFGIHLGCEFLAGPPRHRAYPYYVQYPS